MVWTSAKQNQNPRKQNLKDSSDVSVRCVCVGGDLQVARALTPTLKNEHPPKVCDLSRAKFFIPVQYVPFRASSDASGISPSSSSGFIFIWNIENSCKVRKNSQIFLNSHATLPHSAAALLLSLKTLCTIYLKSPRPNVIVFDRGKKLWLFPWKLWQLFRLAPDPGVMNDRGRSVCLHSFFQCVFSSSLCSTTWRFLKQKMSENKKIL